MSIYLYTGTPGSGKSLHAASEIVKRMRLGKGIIANFPINEQYVKKSKKEVLYLDNSEMTPKALVEYAFKNHKIGKEGQTLVVIDECQVILNCRDFGRKDRNDWINLLAQHRKLGFNFILITQHDRMMDKQARCFVEEEVKHRKINNYGFIGSLLMLTFTSWFVGISYWYGGNKLKIGQCFFRYKKKYSKIYDSYRMFSDFLKPENGPAVGAGGAGGEPPCGGSPGEVGTDTQEPITAMEKEEPEPEKEQRKRTNTKYKGKRQKGFAIGF